MAKQTLLEKALKNDRKIKKMNFTEEEIELAMAWANNEIGLRQVARAMNMRSDGRAYSFIALALRKIISDK